MRCIALLTFVAFGMLNCASASSYVEVGRRTDVDVCANAWDTRKSGDGCYPNGCKPYLTRDGDLDDESRWSCSHELVHETCQLWYTFDEPQVIGRVKIALWKGDERVRTIKFTFYDIYGRKKTETFTSSGTTEDYESFKVDEYQAYKVTVEPEGLGDKWLSILEVQFMVQ